MSEPTYRLGTGWTTTPVAYYYGEDEEHQIAADGIIKGAVDRDVSHRRIIGQWTPEYIQEITDGE